ncbi:MAG: hypothetical protein JWO38_5794 [Gemmataceae bacterium]|nr:hypothetical protein [Gemmataceae bacterium]
MISLPRRSVTRFFIPLIDVLILLFCIFLLMPFVSAPARPDDEKPDAKAPPPAALPTDVQELQKQLAAVTKDRDEAAKRLDRFQKERGERLVVRVLEIDPGSGRLVYYAPGRQEIASQAQAEQLIAYEKRLAGEKDIFFTIQYPRQASKHPTETDLAGYRDWFKNVPHGFEIPRPGS